MTNDRKTFIGDLFHFLADKDYLWLKAISDNPLKVPSHSDIDLFVKKENLEAVTAFASSHPKLANVKIKEEVSATFIHLLFQDGSILKLDLLTQLVRKQWVYLPEYYLLANRIWKNGVATYPPEVLFEHVLLFNFLNHSGLPKKYIGYFSSLPSGEMELLLSFINFKYETNFKNLDEMARFSPLVRRAFVRYLVKNEENTLYSRFNNGLDFFINRIKTMKMGAGEVITFSGVDGAGKTTLLHDLRHSLSHRFGKQVVVLRHRPGLLPILSAWTKGKTEAEKQAATALPRQGTNQSKLSSIFRFAYYFSDYILGQLWVKLRYTLLGYTVIYDRYYFDFIIDGKRSNLNLGTVLPKWLYRFVAKPQLNVFLYASPDVIRKRKKELPAADIIDMTERYQALFAEFSQTKRGKYLCIENLDRDKTLRTILQHLIAPQPKDKQPKQVMLHPAMNNL